MSNAGKNFESKLIILSPDDNVEKYDVGFAFPQLNKETRQKLKIEIEEAGKVIAPILVMPSAVRGYVVLDGWNRYQISKELQLDCQALLFEGLDPKQTQEIFLSENLSRRQMTFIEKKQLAFDLKQNASWSNAQIARALMTDPSTVSKWFNPKEYPPILAHMNIIGINIDKIARELEIFFDNDPRRHTVEHRKQAKEALSPVLLKILRLKKTAEELDQYLAQYIEDSAELAANNCVDTEKGVGADSISLVEIDMSSGILEGNGKKKVSSAACYIESGIEVAQKKG